MESSRNFFLEGWFVLTKCWLWVLPVFALNMSILLSISSNPSVIFTDSFGIMLLLVCFSFVMVLYKAHCEILNVKRTAGEHYFGAIGFAIRGMVPAFMISLGFAGIVILASVGTYLPAYVAQTSTGLKAAYNRGMKDWAIVFFSLLAVNLITVGVIYGYLPTIKYFIDSIILPSVDGQMGPEEAASTMKLIRFFFLIPIFIILFHSICCVAVILSPAYLRDPSVRLDYNAEA